MTQLDSMHPTPHPQGGRWMALRIEKMIDKNSDDLLMSEANLWSAVA